MRAEVLLILLGMCLATYIPRALPAVLVELGFITNPEDAELMSGSPQLFARGIYAGLLKYYGLS